MVLMTPGSNSMLPNRQRAYLISPGMEGQTRIWCALLKRASPMQLLGDGGVCAPIRITVGGGRYIDGPGR